MNQRAQTHPSPATRRLPDVEPFTPLVPTPRQRMVIRALVGPVLWLIALLVVAIVIDRTDAIEFGALVALGSLVISFVGLAVLRARRNRLRRGYAEYR